MADTDFGLAQSSLDTRAAGLKIFNAWRTINNMPALADTTVDEFTNDNLEHLMFSFAGWMSCTNIPQYLKVSSLPALESSHRNVKYLSVNSKEKYLIAVLNEIKKKHGRDPLMKDTLTVNGENPGWFTTMKTRFVNAATRFQMALLEDPDNVVGEADVLALTRPRFKEVEFDPEDAREDLWFLDTPDAQVSAFDLKHVMTNFIRRSMLGMNSKTLLYRAQVSAIYNGIMRGGEVKFQQFNKWQFLPSIPCLEVMNEELKTCKQTQCPMVPDAESPLLCYFHSHACYFSVESGLMRTEDQLRKGHGNFVYPELHAISDKAVAGKITANLRSTLPRGVSKAKVEEITGKSLRKGAITEISMHRQSDIFMVAVRSGHAIECALDYYLDRSNVGLSITGARILAGYEDCYQRALFARLECLCPRNREMVKVFMEHVIPSNIPEWMPGGTKHPLKKLFLASLLHHHKHFLENFGPTCSITSYLNERAREVKLSNPLYPDCSPEMVLQHWSDIVKDDHLKRNKCIYASAQEGISGLKGLLTTVAANQAELIAEVNSLKRKMDDRDLVVDTSLKALEKGVSNIKSTQDNELDWCKSQILHMQHKLASIRTPPHASSLKAQLFGARGSDGESPTSKARIDFGSDGSVVGSVRQTTSEGDTQEASFASNNNPSLVLVSQSRDEAIVEDAYLSATDPNYNLGGGRFAGHSKLVHGNRAASIEKASSNKDYTLALLLEDYHRMGLLKERLHPFHKSVIVCPATVSSNNRTLAHYCLEFMDVVMTPDQIAFLRGNYTDYKQESRKALYAKVQAMAMDELWVWEGKDPDVQKSLVGKTAGAKPKPNITGFGTRVKEYKKKCLERRGEQQEKPNYKSVELVHPKDLPEPGHVTPKGMKNVGSYFLRKTPRSK